MLCEYLRHIDLLQVFEQLDGFIWRENDIALANIPIELSPTPAMYFEDMAETYSEEPYGSPWREMAPIDLAAEIGDVIEADLERLAQAASTKLAGRRASPSKVTDNLSELLTWAMAVDADDYWCLCSLLIYQYDTLCWLHKNGHINKAFEVFEGIATTRGAIAFILDKEVQTQRKSREASSRAAKRHEETNQRKTEAIEHWERSGKTYSGMAAFARLHCKEFGVTERTLYGWIREHRKASA